MLSSPDSVRKNVTCYQYGPLACNGIHACVSRLLECCSAVCVGLKDIAVLPHQQL